MYEIIKTEENLLGNLSGQAVKTQVCLANFVFNVNCFNQLPGKEAYYTEVEKTADGKLTIKNERRSHLN